MTIESLPLTGIKAIEITQLIAGPTANPSGLRDDGPTAYEIHELGVAGAIVADVVAGW